MKTLKFAGAALALALSTQALALGGLADVNVFDRTEQRRLPVYWHEGRAYVVGKVVTGETARPQQSGYVLGPWSGLEVKGWRKSLSRTAAFYFTELADSYAARTGRPADVGVIGVALFRRKSEPPQPFSQLAPAPAERAAEASSPRASAPSNGASAADAAGGAEPLGTGHGRSETSYARRVEFERASAQPAENIAIYYDSYRNLVAMGVIRERARHPRPFPGFVPDPVGALPEVTPSSGA
jgi:hypothetical protein